MPLGWLFGNRSVEVQTQESELDRVWRFWASMLRLSALAVLVVVAETLLLGGWSALLLATIGLVLVMSSESDTGRVTGGVLIGLGALLCALYVGGYWWPLALRAQAGRLYIVTRNAWIALPGWMNLIRLLAALAIPPAFGYASWVVYSRFVREAAMPMLSNVTPRQPHIDGMYVPGIGYLHDLDAEKLTAETVPPEPARRVVTLSVPYPTIEPEAAPGEAVSVGGRNGHGVALAELPLDLFRRSGEAEAEAWTRLGVFCESVLRGAPISRPYWTATRGLFTDPQYRAILDWLRDAGMVAKSGPGRTDGYTLTRGGRSAFAYLLRYLDEYRDQAESGRF